ncbi:MAG: hypothetical protein WDM89_08240 [Rhizomicrobium sp.]
MTNLRIGAAAAVLLFAFFIPAQAGVRDEVLKAMDQCAGVADKEQRLACFDQLAPQVKAALEEIPRAENRPPTVEEQKSWFGFDFGSLFGNASPNQQTTPQQFGAENLPPPPPKEGEPPPPGPIDSITANVSDYAMNPFGKFVVFLEGGEVWKQLEGDAGHATFRASGNTVLISRGALGSYNMQINGSNKAFKVKRVK